jgi:hypothetical protein
MGVTGSDVTPLKIVLVLVLVLVLFLFLGNSRKERKRKRKRTRTMAEELASLPVAPIEDGGASDACPVLRTLKAGRRVLNNRGRPSGGLFTCCHLK